jgi:hypothetical protein
VLAVLLVTVTVLTAVSAARGGGRTTTVHAGATGATAVGPPAGSASVVAPPRVVEPPRATSTTTTTTLVEWPQRVAFFGDSLAVETNPHLARLLDDLGIEYRFDGFGGTATCDYLDEMRETARTFRPDVVVLLFTGNALTPCITSRTGGTHGIVTEDQPLDLLAYAAAYDIDSVAALDAFGPDVHVVLVAPPETRPGRSAAARIVDDLYHEHAAERANVDLLADVELLTPNGEYADSLPCTFVEPCVVGEPVPVRAEDGGHLCRTGGFCFGGFRMALAILDALPSAPPASANW